LAIRYTKTTGFFFGCLFLLSGLEGCVKHEDPTVTTGSPVFGLSGKVEGLPFSMQAGVNDYYMFTQTDVQPHNILGIGGKIAKEGCPETCGPSIQIIFRNHTLDTEFYTDSLFRKTSYAYYNEYDAQHWTYTLKTTQRSSGVDIPQYAWSFGNNMFSTDPEPQVAFREGIYTVTCSTAYPNGCFSHLAQPIFLTPTRVGKQTDFSANYIDTFELLFNSIPINNNAIITWDFGDGNTGDGTIVKHRFAQSGIYVVTMQYIDGTDTMQYSQNVNTLNVSKCKTNYQFTTGRFIDSLQFKSVVIKWTDAQGVVYSSENIPQADNRFNITSVKTYLPNSHNQPTKMLTVSFSCLLSNGNKSIRLENVNGTFAVAVPKP
jgi:hypothetical protein